MNNFLTLNKPLTINEHIQKIYSFLLYKSELELNKPSNLIEINFNSRLELNSSDNNYYFAINDIEVLKNFKGYIRLLDDIDKSINQINKSEHLHYLSKINNHSNYKNVSLFLHNNPTDYYEKIIELEQSIKTDLIIPYFDNNFYSYTKSKIRNLNKNIFFKKIDNYFSLGNLLNSINTVYFINNKFNLKLAEFIFKLYNFNYIIEEDKLYIKFNISKKEIPNVNLLKSNLSPKINFFLVPSANKNCGIADYHSNQKKLFYGYDDSKSPIITLNRLESIPEQAKHIHIHHEFNFFNGSKLSENNYLELVDFIEQTDKTFSIYFHSIPLWEHASSNKEYNYITTIINNPKVNTYTYTSAMFNNLSEYPILPEVYSKIKIIELGLYKINNLPDNFSGNQIGLIGFNTKGKGNNDLVKFLINNTQEEVNIIGLGSSIYQSNNPRLWIIDEYLDNDKFIEHLIQNVKIIICNRLSTASSASASFRLAISLGIPVIASNNIAHTSFFDNTGEDSGLFCFYDNFDQISEFIEYYSDSQNIITYKEKCKELVEKYNMGILTKKLLIG